MKVVALSVRRTKMRNVARWCRDNSVPVLFRHRRVKATGLPIGNKFYYTGEVSRFGSKTIIRSPVIPAGALRGFMAVVRTCDELVFQLRWGPFPAIPEDEYRGIVCTSS